MRNLISKLQMIDPVGDPRQLKTLLKMLLAVVILGAVFLALYLRLDTNTTLVFIAVPALGVLVLMQAVVNYKVLFFLLIACIPISLPLELGSLAIDLPAEPLMIGLSLIFVLELLAGRVYAQQKQIYYWHVLVGLILFWTLFTTLSAEFPVRSVKFLLAKVWYILPFFFLADRLVQGKAEIKAIFWTYFIPLLLVVLITTVKHAAEGFSFEHAHLMSMPFFPNGVIYSATLVMFLPWAWFARSWYPVRDARWYLINVGIALLLLGILLSYKRGAWVAAFMLPVAFIAIKRRLFEGLTFAAIAVVVLGLVFLLANNRFYSYQPDYNKTIYHEGNLEAHLGATLDGTDLSGMERIYRWVAAKNMIAARPIQGFGPSNFNQVYKRYADDAFRTYVSENEEQSTTHNYFLMTFSEQGVVGGGLFLILCLSTLLYGARLYVQCRDPELKIMALMIQLSFFTLILHCILNEIIEVDKTGSFFWLMVLLLHKIGIWDKQKNLSATP